MRQARAAAGDRDVTVAGGPDLGRQVLRAGLVDELDVDIMPILLGEGLRLFDGIGSEPIALERVRVFESGRRTTIRFRVVR